MSTILVVEDENIVRLIAAEILRDEGCKVIEMSTADEALVYCQKTATGIDAILTDINMPGEADGIDLAQIVTDKHPKVLVVVMSGQHKSKPPELSAKVRFLPKPWDGPRLLRALKEAIQQ